MFRKISFVGAGAMAEAIISGIIKKGIVKKENIFVTNKSDQERLKHLREKYHIQCVADKEAVMQEADIVLLAMPPKELKQAVQSVKNYLTAESLIISVAAGISTDAIAQQFEGKNPPIIRAMPNMPAMVGCSATAIAKGNRATDEHVRKAISLFQTIGTTTIFSEADMHLVTGVSGSGPAYVYYLAEAMLEAAVGLGLERAAAEKLISQTFFGAGTMLRDSEKTARELKEEVISPGGTTEAGTLMNQKFEEIIFECIKNARDRSVELGK